MVGNGECTVKLSEQEKQVAMAAFNSAGGMGYGPGPINAPATRTQAQKVSE